MAYITWRTGYELGFRIIDEQHKKLVEIINELYDAQQHGTSRTIISDTLDKLIDYTTYHFDSEEELFKQYNYPYADLHIAEHAGFIREVVNLKSDLVDNNLLLSLKTLDFLKDWTINHILGTDKDFSEFVREQETGR
jgi:hemerythrin-like metal-binding protein